MLPRIAKKSGVVQLVMKRLANEKMHLSLIRRPSFFDQENVQIKYQLPSNKISYEKENRYVFCFLMEYAEKGDLS